VNALLCSIITGAKSLENLTHFLLISYIILRGPVIADDPVGYGVKVVHLWARGGKKNRDVKYPGQECFHNNSWSHSLIPL
jgi:hypothetical protein